MKKYWHTQTIRVSENRKVVSARVYKHLELLSEKSNCLPIFFRKSKIRMCSGISILVDYKNNLLIDTSSLFVAYFRGQELTILLIFDFR